MAASPGPRRCAGRRGWPTPAARDATQRPARFWNAEGAKLLAPLLHAAALADLGMGEVLRWLDERDDEHPTDVLDLHEATAAHAQLAATLKLDPRNAGTTYMSAAALLEAYRHPPVQRTETTADFTAQAFLDGKPNTLYIVADADDQELLAPIVVALLREVLSLAAARYNQTGERISPALRLVGDELPNIAPIRSLPRYVATLLDAGVRIVSVCQDLAQLRECYGRSADTILSNSQCKLFLGPVSCPETRKYLVELLGDEPVATTSRTRGEKTSRSEQTSSRPRATGQLLQQLDAQHGLVIHSNLPAAIIRTRPWWQRSRLARRCRLPIPAPAPAAPQHRAPAPGFGTWSQGAEDRLLAYLNARVRDDGLDQFGTDGAARPDRGHRGRRRFHASGPRRAE